MNIRDIEYLSVDGYPVTVGGKFWDNNLRVVEITKVADWSDPYQGETQTWHDTTGGHADTISGSLREYGRLVRFDPFEHKDARAYPAGTSLRSL